MTSIAPFHKTVVAVTAVLAALLSAAVLPADATRWVQLALGVVGAIGVYAVPNVPVPGETPTAPTQTPESPSSTTVSSPSAAQ